MDAPISKEQFREIKHELTLSLFSRELCPAVSEHLAWEAVMNELVGAWYPMCENGFVPKMVRIDQESPAVALSKISRKDFPIYRVVELVGNLWKETCQLKEKISRDFFELEAADQCEAGKKIVPFLRGSINCFTGPSRVAKEQRSKEFDAAKGMLKKFGLL